MRCKIDHREGGTETNLRYFILISVFLISIFAAPAVFAAQPPTQPDSEEIQILAKTTAVIKTRFGEIVLRFFPDVAPVHVKNFLTLAKGGFYDGTVFHRVIPGFMIQGGDPKSKELRKSGHGTGGPGYTIKAEFSNKPHNRGTLSMARMQDPNSAGSQFFISVARTKFLDGKYTVFGEVVSGLEVVDRIVNQPRDRRDNPFERVEIAVSVIEPVQPENMDMEKTSPDTGGDTAKKDEGA